MSIDEEDKKMYELIEEYNKQVAEGGPVLSVEDWLENDRKNLQNRKILAGVALVLICVAVLITLL